MMALPLRTTHQQSVICHRFSFAYPQVGLTGSQVWWATDVGIAFERVEEGFETALKDYNRKQVALSIQSEIL